MEKEVTEVYPSEETEEQQSESQPTDLPETIPLEKTSCTAEADDDFVWEDYLDETGTIAVPPTAFVHVEKSLESGVLEDQLVEIVHNESSELTSCYWPAKVVTTCGPLLRLRYVTHPSVNVECWKEVALGGLHPIGWCALHNIEMSPVPDLIDSLIEESELQKAKVAVEEALSHGVSVPGEAFDGEGYTAVERIKQGMKVEVLYKENPTCGWVATVIDNVGGRLLLRYDTPDCSGLVFWLFYLSPRLRPPDWIHHQGPPWRYKHPESCSQYEEAEWAALLEMSRDDARRSPLPNTLLSPALPVSAHQFTDGMLIEAVHPTKPNSVHVAKITLISDESRFFEVSIEGKEGDNKVTWTTCVDDPLILPARFCEKNGIALVPPGDWQKETDFSWDAYLQSCSIACADDSLFPKHEPAEDVGFEVGLRLEAANPYPNDQICVATVKKVTGHLLHIQLDSELETEPYIMSSTCQDIFPTGWSQSNNYPLHIPAEYSPQAKVIEDPTLELCQNKNGDNPQNDPLSNVSNQRSLWCPRLYVNHWCYTGPYLSKSKVAKQSQSVGPGSVELVLREVLSMTINAAYIPTRVLRELERNAVDSHLVSSTWHPTHLKAKFKRYTYTASISVATTASDVSDFLNFICHTLQCCPNLWSPTQSGENCPFLCTSQMFIQGSQSSSMRGRGRIAITRGTRGGPGMTRIFHRRKRGGRKRLFVPVRANRLLQPKSLSTQSDDITEDGDEDEDVDIEEGDDDEVASGSDEGDTSSRSSRPTSPILDPSFGNRRRRRGFPRMEMQTRGIKLPDYANQLKMRHVKRKFEGGEGSSSASSCREEPLDRMKRGRKSEYPDGNSGLEPASVTSDPLEWTVHDVEQYVASQPAICHHAVRLREQEVDGRAFLLLNLPTLVQHLGLPHSSAVALAQHVCRVKLAHFLFFYRAEA